MPTVLLKRFRDVEILTPTYSIETLSLRRMIQHEKNVMRVYLNYDGHGLINETLDYSQICHNFFLLSSSSLAQKDLSPWKKWPLSQRFEGCNARS